MPFDWGISEFDLEEVRDSEGNVNSRPSKFTKSSLWKSSGKSNEWWKASFVDENVSVLSVKVTF